MRRFVSFVALVPPLLGCASQEPVNLPAETLQVKTVVNQLTTALENEDMKMLWEVMAHDADMVNLGTDANERWVGWDALAAAARKQFESFQDTKLTVHDQVIKLDDGGRMAWFSEIVDWDLNAGNTPVQIIGSRITGVMQKRKDKWVCVQFHASVPVAGQAARY